MVDRFLPSCYAGNFFNCNAIFRRFVYDGDAVYTSFTSGETVIFMFTTVWQPWAAAELSERISCPVWGAEMALQIMCQDASLLRALAFVCLRTISRETLVLSLTCRDAQEWPTASGFPRTVARGWRRDLGIADVRTTLRARDIPPGLHSVYIVSPVHFQAGVLYELVIARFKVTFAETSLLRVLIISCL